MEHGVRPPTLHAEEPVDALARHALPPAARRRALGRTAPRRPQRLRLRRQQRAPDRRGLGRVPGQAGTCRCPRRRRSRPSRSPSSASARAWRRRERCTTSPTRSSTGAGEARAARRPSPSRSRGCASRPPTSRSARAAALVLEAAREADAGDRAAARAHRGARRDGLRSGGRALRRALARGGVGAAGPRARATRWTRSGWRPRATPSSPGSRPRAWSGRCRTSRRTGSAASSTSRARLHGLRGGASGLVAIDLAVRALRAGELDAARRRRGRPVARGGAPRGARSAGPRARARRRRGGAGAQAPRRRAPRRERGPRGARPRTRPPPRSPSATPPAGSISNAIFGAPHAATGLLHVAAGALALRHRARPRLGARATPWFGERRVEVAISTLEAPPRAVRLAPGDRVAWLGIEAPPRLHVYSGRDREEVLVALEARRESDAGPARLVLVAADGDELAARADAAQRWLRRGGPPPEGVAFRERPVDGELAFVFTGAAAAYPGMGRDLALGLPGLVDAVAARCEEMHRSTDWLYGPGDGTPAHPLDQLWGTSLRLPAPRRAEPRAARTLAPGDPRLLVGRIERAVRARGVDRPRRDDPREPRRDDLHPRARGCLRCAATGVGAARRARRDVGELHRVGARRARALRARRRAAGPPHDHQHTRGLRDRRRGLRVRARPGPARPRARASARLRHRRALPGARGGRTPSGGRSTTARRATCRACGSTRTRPAPGSSRRRMRRPTRSRGRRRAPWTSRASSSRPGPTACGCSWSTGRAGCAPAGSSGSSAIASTSPSPSTLQGRSGLRQAMNAAAWLRGRRRRGAMHARWRRRCRPRCRRRAPRAGG